MRIMFFVLLAVYSLSAHAFENFIDNEWSPYPAGCVTIPDMQLAIYGDNAKQFFGQELTLPNAQDLLEDLPVNVFGLRVACADANRSVIWVVFKIPDTVLPAGTFYITPEAHAIINGKDIPLRLAGEPNNGGSGTEPDGSGQIFGGPVEFGGGLDKEWIFVLDNVSAFASNFDPDNVISASQYNDSFQLDLVGINQTYSIQVPSTASTLDANAGIPLSGRLSGNWVVQGVPDQGFVIAISELTDSLDPLMFLSWYTYDNDGKLLWLTGAAQFEIGDTRITIPIELVTNGQFLGSKTADREVVGSVIITSNDCNDLSFHYELNDINLGSGDEKLQRVFSLETAGYVCRDLEARIEAN